MSTLDNSNISVHLGKTSQYKAQYDPTLLVREPRASNRNHLSIDDDNLPFIGYDVWNAYEVSALNKNGLPITGIVKITYPASSKYIVESKSLKLYMNTFNMTVFTSHDPVEIYRLIEDIIAKDLSSLLETEVTVKMFGVDSLGFSNLSVIEDRYDYITLERYYPLRNIECNSYRETPELLNTSYVNSVVTHQKYHSSLLKSNCRVTSQPDWGDVYISYKGLHAINAGSLLKYIVSFRDECHFHEEICETIYKRLMDKFEPVELTVTCLYVRRGGIDINPIRSYKADGIYKVFTDKDIPFTKTARQ